MAIGERIKFFRNLRGVTQKWLGTAVGFPEHGADTRIGQYECHYRKPKAGLTEALASALEVSPRALTVPDIDSSHGLQHTLFAIEDIYGLEIDTLEGQPCLRLNKYRYGEYAAMYPLFSAWAEQAARYRSGEITKAQYDQWRYNQ